MCVKYHIYIHILQYTPVAWGHVQLEHCQVLCEGPGQKEARRIQIIHRLNTQNVSAHKLGMTRVTSSIQSGYIKVYFQGSPAITANDAWPGVNSKHPLASAHVEQTHVHNSVIPT